MSEAALAVFVLAYAALLAAGSFVAEGLAPGGRLRSGSAWARAEAAAFRRGMARIVRVIASFLAAAVAVREWATPWGWAALGLLALVAGATVARARSAGGEDGRLAG